MSAETPKVPDVEGEEEPEGDSGLSAAEAFSLGRGLPARDLRREADEADHDRSERYKGHFDKIGIAGLYGGAILVGVAGLFWFWHLLTPWSFLTEDQLAHLQNLLTGGVLVSVATSYVQKRLG